MDFSLTETQREIKSLAEKILNEQVTPQKQKALEMQGERFDADLWQLLCSAGLIGVAIDERYGGMGLSFAELVILVEEVGRTIAAVPVVPVLVSAALVLQRFASEAQQQQWLPVLVQGRAIITVALMEKNNEDAAMPMSKACAQADGSWRLTGVKWCVPVARQAQRIMLSAQTEQGVGLFLLDPQASGVNLVAMENTAKEPQYLLELNNAHVLASDVLALDAQQIIQWMQDRTLIAYCVMQTGIADRAMRMTASYTAERQQFGVPIATFQAVGHRAANSYIDVCCQRWVTQQAVLLLNNEQPAIDEVHIAKIWSGECGHRVSFAAQHLHGGIGIDKDYPLWRYCVWSRHIEMLLGSSSEHTAKLGERIAQGLSCAS